MSVATRLENITPKKAANYLEKLAPNRPRSDYYARRLAAAIKNGEWKTNGETIKFNENDGLEDGQHRLLAVILADTSIQTFVTRGLPVNDGIFETIDTGKRRNVGDVFARRGIAHYTIVASAIAWLHWWQNGLGCLSRQHPRHAEALALLESHPKIVDSANIGRNCRDIFSPSVACCLHYLFSRVSQHDADDFFHKLSTGENISKSDPRTSGVYWIRNRLLENRTSKSKLVTEHIFPLLVKAWNAYRSKIIVKTLRFTVDEEFPKIQ